MNKLFIRRNLTSISIIIFVCIFISIQYFKPVFLYNRFGALREFGIGKKNKTILPIWLLAFILAIFSYLSVLYYISAPRY